MSTEFLAESGLRRDRDPRRMNDDDGMLARRILWRILFHYYSNTLTKMPSRADPIQNLVLVIPPTILQSSNYTSIYIYCLRKRVPELAALISAFFPHVQPHVRRDQPRQGFLRLSTAGLC